jgi:peptide/nickel transport system substrate-binding protein
MIRRLVLGIPLALLAMVLVALVNSAMLSRDPENIMTIGTLGEASNLNPILSTDASSSQVSSLIFQSLLTVDEDMNPKGELAEDWELSQRTTFFFSNPEVASAALLRIEPLLDEKGTAGIHSVGGFQELRIQLMEPGMDFSRTLAELLPEALPLFSLEVALADGGAANWTEKLRMEGTLPGAVRWFSESNRQMEITVAGAAGEARRLLEEFLQGGGAGEFEIVVEETGSFLAEPEVHFTLRQGVTWQDGASFTSDDVRFTYEAIMDDAVASPRKPDFTLVYELLTPGPHEVLVRYRRPYAPALNSWRMSIIPAHILRQHPPAWWAENFNRRPVGTGPFKIGEWRTNEFIRLDRNPGYWQAPGPWLDGVVFRVLPDPLTLRLAFETRMVDFWTVDPWAMRSFREDDRFQIFTAPSSSYTYVGWNLRRPMFQDPRVRRALAHAVNVPQMIEFLLYGYGLQSTGIFTPQMWFFDPGVQPLPYDKEKARTLLAEAGWLPGPDGILQKDGRRFSFTLITNNANEIRRDIATLMQDDLKQVGIEVAIELYEWAVLISRYVSRSEFDAIVLGWSLAQDDFDQFQIWHSSQTNPEQLNVVGYQNAEVDFLLEEIRQEFNRDRVLQLASELQSTIFGEQPYLFLFVPEGTSVMWNDAYRVCRPDGEGGWIEEPVRLTKAGWSIYMEWFFRPEFADRLPEERRVVEPGELTAEE